MRKTRTEATTPAPSRRSLAALRTEAAHCRACPLWKNATQTVFGAGRATARILLVGEQPGDREDLAGKPVVGPAGRVHPSFLLRVPDEDRDTAFAQFVEDLKLARKYAPAAH